MITSLALLLFAIASGTLATYLYDESDSFAGRLCAGACIGITVLGLAGFVFASFLGLTTESILLTLIVLLIPFVSLINRERRLAILGDLGRNIRSITGAISHPSRIPLGYTAFYLVVAAVFWQCFQRAVIETPEGIATGVLNNFGDLPFHLSVITSFAYGNNFMPEDPTYSGVRFTYPFLTDFISAIFVRTGASLRQSMLIENFVVAMAFVGLLHRWALVMLRDRLAAVLTPLLVLLNGGLGWVLFIQQAMNNHGSFVEFIKALPPSFTVIPETTWRWGNAISALLIPQRGFLLGLPLVVIVLTQWWLSTSDRATEGHGDELKKGPAKKNLKVGSQSRAQRNSNFRGRVSPALSISPTHRMIAAGVIAGLLPLVHAHSFVVLMMVGACLALLQRPWRPWIVFFAVVSAIALPQMWWSTHNSAVDAGKFFEIQFGWDRGTDSALWFWIKNSGLFIPLTITALLWKDRERLVSRRLLIFFLPFTLCFIIPNVLKMAPWIWDNIKVLFYWWLASAPLVALLLARLWRQGIERKIIAIVLFLCVTAAGALDVAAILVRSSRHQVFDAAGIKFAETIKNGTEPRSLIIHAPVHNHPVFLTGRRSLMGYPGHVWTHGLDYTQRESEIRRVYGGAPDAAAIIRKYGIEYAVLSPLERSLMTVSDNFFSQFQLVGEVGGYRLYKITRQ
ncbi:MAG TPA: hypothetical protein VGW36_01585 [Pyrinomonadaceae bacterium]|nr:hypothetical protein [Pyrinomonadaceae bacterium]